MSERLARFLRHALAVLLSALFLLPLWWVIVASLREPGLPPPNTVQWWPAAPFWDNYPAIFRVVSFARYALNSAIVVAVAVPLTLITASLAGLGLAQLEGAWRRRVLMITIGLLIVPSASGWMFRFQLLRWLHLLDSLWALIVPALGASSPLFVL
ncbi:MAG: carbohydrate ABC transporter permease, partial [Anaerolineae bacterium]